jgi:uncharacterized protein YkwD
MKNQRSASGKSKSNLQLFIYWVILICLLFGSPLFLANAQEPLDPGEPPIAPPPEEIQNQLPRSPLILDFETQIFLPLVLRFSTFPVNPQNRFDSLSFFQQEYLMASYPTPDWNGSQGACNPGTTSPEFRAAILRRINYFRAMAGIPNDVVFSDASNLKAQAAALIMSANQSLSHGPTQTWACYSDLGRNGAASANLYLGRYGWDAIDGYMKDPGEGNYPAGHRRWILYPQTKEMGTGDIPTGNGYPSAQALVVFDSHLWDPRPATREEFVAWPPPGYVPYQVVFGRWSFAYPGANFSGASVHMTAAGQNLTVNQSPVVNGFGENTLVWIPEGHSYGEIWPKPASDASYSVTIDNVIINGNPRSFIYTVIIFNPGL